MSLNFFNHRSVWLGQPHLLTPPFPFPPSVHSWLPASVFECPQLLAPFHQERDWITYYNIMLNSRIKKRAASFPGPPILGESKGFSIDKVTQLSSSNRRMRGLLRKTCPSLTIFGTEEWQRRVKKKEGVFLTSRHKKTAKAPQTDNPRSDEPCLTFVFHLSSKLLLSQI